MEMGQLGEGGEVTSNWVRSLRWWAYVQYPKIRVLDRRFIVASEAHGSRVQESGVTGGR